MDQIEASPIIRVTRSVILIVLSVLCLLFALLRVAQGQDPLALADLNRILSNEQRISQLEARQGDIVYDLRKLSDDVASERNYSFLQLIALSGLLGETGIRLVRKKDIPKE